MPEHHPSVRSLLEALDMTSVGEEMYSMIERAYPICRSITGDGVRQTLGLIDERIPLQVREVPSGTPVLDWTVPKEWNVREAWVKDPSGRKVIDFAESNLHLLGYSTPIRATLSLQELDEHLYSLPEQPELTPYRTSYYQERWGFCLPHSVRESLAEGEYEVLIDATLEAGGLTYGECLLPGTETDEVLISCHVCHPSLCNDNLSGLAVSCFLAAQLASVEQSERRFTYRFVFVPGTIGPITWLADNREVTGHICHGLVAVNLGDEGGFHYKKSRGGNAEIDAIVPRAFLEAESQLVVEDFVPFGYDERQYCSPGFDLPVGVLSRTPWGRYPEYHTSADDLDLIRPQALAESLQRYLQVVAMMEANRKYRNLAPHGEPQLGRRGLYESVGGSSGGRDRELALLWVLNQSDGSNSLLDIAQRSDLAFWSLFEAAQSLVEAGLLAEA